MRKFPNWKAGSSLQRAMAMNTARRDAITEGQRQSAASGVSAEQAERILSALRRAYETEREAARAQLSPTQFKAFETAALLRYPPDNSPCGATDDAYNGAGFRTGEPARKR